MGNYPRKFQYLLLIGLKNINWAYSKNCNLLKIEIFTQIKLFFPVKDDSKNKIFEFEAL